MVEQLSIAPLAAGSCFSLRMRATAAVELNNAGLSPFDIAINTCSVTNGRISARLGPDEWLLLGDSDGSSLARELHVALAGDNFSLVDIGHRNVAIAVAGGHAREVINGDCPLDLDDEAFPPGSATRTLLGKAEIILLRPGAEASYRLECWRSFAPYVLALLKEVGRELESS